MGDESIFPLLLRGHRNPVSYTEAKAIAHAVLADKRATYTERVQAWTILHEYYRKARGES